MARYKGGGKARSGYDITSSDLPFYDINPRLVKAGKYDEKLLRSEYTRMRDIAQKRLKRLEASEEGQYIAGMHPEGFPKIKELSDRADLVKALMDVSGFLTAKRSSLSGLRESIKETQESIYEETGIEIPKEQLANYGRFLNKMKKELGLKPGTYETKYIAEVWSDLKNRGKITKTELRDAVNKYLDEYDSSDEKENRKRADRIAFKIDKYFDISDLDKRTVSALRRTGAKKGRRKR